MVIIHLSSCVIPESAEFIFYLDESMRLSEYLKIRKCSYFIKNVVRQNMKWLSCTLLVQIMEDVELL